MIGPIFIVGMFRSGTTLLSEILNSHSMVAIAPETHYLDIECQKESNSLLFKDRRETETFIYNLLRSKEIQQFNLSFQELAVIESKLLNKKKLSHKLIFETLLDHYAQKHHKKIKGEKTPRHIEHLQTIFNWFPNAKVVCIIRDPRDVSLSLRKVPWGSQNILYHVKIWRSYVKICNRFIEQNDQRFYLIRFEDLLTNATVELKKLCSFLTIAYEETLCDFHKSNPKTFKKNIEPWKENATKAINPNNIFKWKKNMPPHEITFFQIILRKELKKHRYPFSKVVWSFSLLSHLLGMIIRNAILSVKVKIKILTLKRPAS
jgi:sulfotransferase family protein